MASATWAVRESSGLEGGAPNCPHGQEKHGAADRVAGGEVPGQVKGKRKRKGKALLRGAYAHACRRLGRAVQGGETGEARHRGWGRKGAKEHCLCHTSSGMSSQVAGFRGERRFTSGARGRVRGGRQQPSSSFIVNTVYMY
ncbi:conserved hypothetical protein [Cupriavidus phytorum]|uniref:Uncharacterized protein n=1 Tax=Cupriavidus taiwanensis TaxID=164546 RepID=A0A976A7D1_9BURK|nr:conserved hypothetical protein [Cupriavidus taiwanensis]